MQQTRGEIVGVLVVNYRAHERRRSVSPRSHQRNLTLQHVADYLRPTGGVRGRIREHSEKAGVPRAAKSHLPDHIEALAQTEVNVVAPEFFHRFHLVQAERRWLTMAHEPPVGIP